MIAADTAAAADADSILLRLSPFLVRLLVLADLLFPLSLSPSPSLEYIMAMILNNSALLSLQLTD